MKIRLDQYLVDKGYFDSREKAKRSIMAADVIINENAITKAGTMIKEEDIKSVRIKNKLNFVSRGALKLLGAINEWKIDFNNKVVLDIGASTGGFTDCSLRHGASYVYAVDVGTNQLAYSLRQNEKVKSIENTHINKLEESELEYGLADIVVCDVSFISLTKIIEFVYKFSKDNSSCILLIKPQFEVGPENIGKNGVVKEEKYREYAISKVLEEMKKYEYEIIGIKESPIKGAKGNIEYLMYARKKV
ncbi:TlyA family RNA methyltransferase [Oceanivirga miroungae]|uniref:Hemolysin A n=1 Tax=Oceanivirga miroungae TaxID=1130046 RepID=A0A6I8M7I4_9FUSO|nr:TlyA family RNA methyltransferase [Oceanivirga miroungae]VWL85386.1 hemolysin A [Oceanivirga miroungae]